MTTQPTQPPPPEQNAGGQPPQTTPGGLPVPPVRLQPTVVQAGASYQYFFLSIVAAIIVIFIVFPGAALGVFYPPCIYNFPRPTVATTTGANALGVNAQILVATPTSLATDTPLVALTPSPNPTASAATTPGASTPVAAATLPASLATATAEVRELLIASRLGLQDDAANYAVYTHCLASFNSFIDYTVKFLAIAAAVITTISATQGWRVIGFTSGALVTALTAFQTTFPMENRASFYQSVANQVDSVVAEVRFSVLDEQQLRQIRMGFDQVKANAAAGPVVRAVATQTALPSMTVSSVATVARTLAPTVTPTPDGTPQATAPPTTTPPTTAPTPPASPSPAPGPTPPG